MHPGFLSPYIKSKTKEMYDYCPDTDFKLRVCNIPQITLAEDLYENLNIKDTNNLLVIYHKMYNNKIYNYKIYIFYIINSKMRESYKQVE